MTFGATQTSAGKVYKYFDLKWSFLLSVLVFEVGSLVCGVAHDPATLIVGRAIAGLGGAGLSVGGTSIVSFTVPPAKRPMMMGIIGMTYAVAAVLGPIIGGAFTSRISWRWCFLINLPIGGLAAVSAGLFFRLPAAASPPKVSWAKKLLHVDPVGIVLAMGGIVCFILALQNGGTTYAWRSSVVIGLLIGFGLLVIALIGWETWLGEYAMMLPRLYKQRSLSSTAPYQFFFMGSYIVLLYYLPIYFQSILGASPIRSGVDNLPLVLAAAVFALAGGAVVMKTGRAQQVMFIGSMLSTVAVGLLYTLDIGTPAGKWIGYQFFVGAFMAFAIMHGLTVAQAHVASEDLTAVTANLLCMYSCVLYCCMHNNSLTRLIVFQTLGGAFSTSAGQAAFVNRLVVALPEKAPLVRPAVVLLAGASELRVVIPPHSLPGVLEAYMIGLKAAFAVAIAFCGVAFLCSFAIPTGKLPSHALDPDPMVTG
jgi:MFS family permease